MVSSSLLYCLLPSSCEVSATCPDPPSTVLLKTSQVTSSLKYLVNSCPQRCLRTFTRSCDTAYFVVLFTDAELHFQAVTIPPYLPQQLPCPCHWSCYSFHATGLCGKGPWHAAQFLSLASPVIDPGTPVTLLYNVKAKTKKTLSHNFFLLYPKTDHKGIPYWSSLTQHFTFLIYWAQCVDSSELNKKGTLSVSREWATRRLIRKPRGGLSLDKRGKGRN